MSAPADDLARRHGATMNEIARRAICGDRFSKPSEKLPPEFARPGASFVTLHKAGKLRGCCGSVTARRPLVEDIRANAVRSAFRDPRFCAAGAGRVGAGVADRDAAVASGADEL